MTMQPAADIILSPPPVRPRPVPLHPPAVAHTRTKIAEGTLTGLKLDTNPLPERYPVHLPNIAQGSYSTTATKVQVFYNYSNLCIMLLCLGGTTE